MRWSCRALIVVGVLRMLYCDDDEQLVGVGC